MKSGRWRWLSFRDELWGLLLWAGLCGSGNASTPLCFLVVAPFLFCVCASVLHERRLGPSEFTEMLILIFPNVWTFLLVLLRDWFLVYYDVQKVLRHDSSLSLWWSRWYGTTHAPSRSHHHNRLKLEPIREWARETVNLVGKVRHSHFPFPIKQSKLPSQSQNTKETKLEMPSPINIQAGSGASDIVSIACWRIVD